jgi:hypothetical protein
MAETLNPTSELNAVNVMLTNIGENPVNTLTGTLGLDASTAQIVLREASRQVQSRGYFWNTERVRLSPNGDSEIALPANTMSVRSAGVDAGKAYTYRNGKLYNATDFENTFTFTANAELEIIYELDFEVLPETARRYITLLASRIFQERKLGTHPFLLKTETMKRSHWLSSDKMRMPMLDAT